MEDDLKQMLLKSVSSYYTEDLKIKWHKISDGDFPKTTGDYLTIYKNKNKEDGIYLYEVAYYTGDGWDNRIHYEDIIAWCELPKYFGVEIREITPHKN